MEKSRSPGPTVVTTRFMSCETAVQQVMSHADTCIETMFSRIRPSWLCDVYKFPKQLGCKGSSSFLQASKGDADPESVAPAWLPGCPVARGWFYSKTNGVSISFGLFACKTNGFSISFGLFACKTNVFSTISVARSIKPMLFQWLRLPDL